jgi:hypothetical protein
MNSGRYILKDGEVVPCPDLMEWAKWYERADEQRRVGYDIIGGVRLSTVFLGLDHSFGSFGGMSMPVLFETMIFGGPLDGTQERYCTIEQARLRHRSYAIVLRRPWMRIRARLWFFARWMKRLMGRKA